MVTSVGATPANSTTGSASVTSAAASTGGDFETFLKMLTTQLQNQDPLSPMESTEFAVQLATFSGVEQQARTNSLLTQLVESSGGGQLGQLSTWIGREVRTTAPVWFQDAPVTLELAPAEDADSVTLVVLDANGREVSRENVGTGAGEVDWRGRNADGELLPAGLYQFRTESLKAGEVVATADVAAYSKVTGAELTATGSALVLEGDNAVSLDEVTAVRE